MFALYQYIEYPELFMYTIGMYNENIFEYKILKQFL